MNNQKRSPHSTTHITMRWSLIILTIIIGMGGMAYATSDPIPSYDHSPQYQNGRFHNPEPLPALSLAQSLKLWIEFLLAKAPYQATPDTPLPVHTLKQADLLSAPDNSVWRLGHSSLLFKIQGKFWLIDPVFSSRASPLSWFGPKRFQPPPIAASDLPPIEAVIISHNHYDHLDADFIRLMHGRVKHFIAPLGVGALLVAWGVAANQVQELDWWGQINLDGIRVVATPARHFSGRGLFDGNRTLWASWVITGKDFNLFFSGDSGYFNGFKAIGRQYGPFDMAFIEAGAYDPRWKEVHMFPDQVIKATRDLNSKRLVPIHNATFSLAAHPWYAPLDQVSRLAIKAGLPVSTPMLGERLSILTPGPSQRWWTAASNSNIPRESQ
jgi:L-ascorbate metabolism protein UlaG (beta-lactamase superfamily)